MKLLKYIPLQLVFFQVIGILMGFFIPTSPKSIAISLLIMFFVLTTLYVLKYFSQMQNGYFIACAFLIFIAIGIASITFNDALNKQEHYSHLVSKQEDLVVLQIDKILKPNTFSDRYIATITSINSIPTQGKILLSIQKDSASKKLPVATRMAISALLKTITSPKNPYQFNYKAYLQKQQIYHQIVVDVHHYTLLKANISTTNGWAYDVQVTINKALKKSDFSGDELAIINALLLGQRQEVSQEMLENYQNAGAIHILAVSGLHIGIILVLLNFLFRPLERLKYGVFIKLFLIVSLLWVYALIAGMSSSIIRAVTMFTAVAISLTVKKSVDVYKTLIISIFFLLLYNPYYLFDVGFQLSYVAVFFIVLVQPILYNSWSPKLKVVDYLWQLFTVSTAAQIGVLPLSLYYFHQFPSLFFISNLIIIPFLGFILGFGILVIALALLDLLPNFVAQFYESVILFMNTIVEWIAKQEAFVFQQVSFSVLSVVIYFFLSILFFRWISTKKYYYLQFTLILIILFQLNLVQEKWKRNTAHEFIIFHKVGNTIFGIREGEGITLNHTLKERNIKEDYVIKAYLNGTSSKIIASKDSIKSIYQIVTKKLVVIDSLGIYALQKLRPDYILLTNSPRINLDRLLKELKPRIVIADGSNYKNRIELWKKTCKKYNTTFRSTVIDGAFVEKHYPK